MRMEYKGKIIVKMHDEATTDAVVESLVQHLDGTYNTTTESSDMCIKGAKEIDLYTTIEETPTEP